MPTPGANVARAVFGALNIRTGRWVCLIRERTRAADFLAFLDSVLAVYPLGPIVLIVDNFSGHAARAVTMWLSTHPRPPLLYSLKYCSQLHPVERI